MALIRHTMTVSALPEFLADPDRGPISLVGDHGGHSAITGEISPSGLVMGTVSIETEHGTIYLDPEESIDIVEDDARVLDDRVPGMQQDLTRLIEDQLNERLDWYASTRDKRVALLAVGRDLAETLDSMVAQNSTDNTNSTAQDD